MFEQLTVEQWRERILLGWERYGTGEPLDPRTVQHLAEEFAKPLMPTPTRWPFLISEDSRMPLNGFYWTCS